MFAVILFQTEREDRKPQRPRHPPRLIHLRRGHPDLADPNDSLERVLQAPTLNLSTAWLFDRALCLEFARFQRICRAGWTRHLTIFDRTRTFGSGNLEGYIHSSIRKNNGHFLVRTHFQVWAPNIETLWKRVKNWLQLETSLKPCRHASNRFGIVQLDDSYEAFCSQLNTLQQDLCRRQSCPTCGAAWVFWSAVYSEAEKTPDKIENIRMNVYYDLGRSKSPKESEWVRLAAVMIDSLVYLMLGFDPTNDVMKRFQDRYNASR